MKDVLIRASYVLVIFFISGLSTSIRADQTTSTPVYPPPQSLPTLMTSEKLIKLGIPERALQRNTSKRGSLWENIIGNSNAGFFSHFGGGFNISTSTLGSGAMSDGLAFFATAFPGSSDSAAYCPRCYDPYLSFGNVTEDQTVAASIQLFEMGLAAFDSATSIPRPGSSNSLFSNISTPTQYRNEVQIQNTLSVDALMSTLDNPIMNTVLGYNQNSNYNFTSQYLQNYNNYFQYPWTSSNNNFSTLSFRRGNVVQTPLDDITTRLERLRARQLDILYTDQAIRVLYLEAYRFYSSQLVTDPYYIYWSYELTAFLNQIRALQPSYQHLLTLYGEISTWTAPPNDNSVLIERYFKRLYFHYLHSALDYETNAYLATDVTAGQWIRQVSQNLVQLVITRLSSDVVNTWYDNWIDRFYQAYLAAIEPLVDELDALFAEYPDYKELIDLTGIVKDDIPNYRQHTDVQTMTADSFALFNNPTATQEVQALYDRYQLLNQTLTGTTQLWVEIERFYERLNGLLINNDAYQLLVNQQYPVFLDFQAYYTLIHNAVANCYFINGVFCDPYSDTVALQLINSSEYQELIGLVSVYYTIGDTFTYLFYQTDDYKTLENNMATRVRNTLAPVKDLLDANRKLFVDDFNAIAQIKTFRENQSALLTALRQQPLSADKGTPVRKANARGEVNTLGDTLDRMSQLAQKLATVSTPNQRLIFSNSFER